MPFEPDAVARRMLDPRGWSMVGVVCELGREVNGEEGAVSLHTI